MTRVRALFGFACLLLVLGAAPMAAAQDAPAEGEPAVVIESGAEAAEEEAWTFRFLVPTLLGLTAVAVVGVGLAYGIRVRGKYRVAR